MDRERPTGSSTGGPEADDGSSEVRSGKAPIQRPRSRGRWMGALAVVLLAVIGTIVTQRIGDVRQQHEAERALEPMVAAADAFPVPAGATVAMEPYKSTDPLEVVRTWKSDKGLDASCQLWKDAFRSWAGSGTTGDVTGEAVPGSSCAFAARRGPYLVQLQLASYSGSAPQATLSVLQ